MTPTIGRSRVALVLTGATLLAGCGSSAPQPVNTSGGTTGDSSAQQATGAAATTDVKPAHARSPAKRRHDPRSKLPTGDGLVVAGASAKDARTAGRALARLNLRCQALPAPGGVAAVGGQRAAGRARLASKLIARVRVPAAVHGRVAELAVRLGQLASLDQRVGSRPTKRLAALVQRSEIVAQADAASLGLAACGPLGR